MDIERKTHIPAWVQVVFDNTEGFNASLAQDLVYALICIAEGERRPQDRLLSIDYLKSPSAVFQDWAKSIIKTTCRMWPLNVFEDRSMPQATDLPSWVPDLRISRHRILVSTDVKSPKDRHYYSSAQYDQDIAEESILRLRGCRRIAVSNFRSMPNGPLPSAWPSWTLSKTNQQMSSTREYCRPTPLGYPAYDSRQDGHKAIGKYLWTCLQSMNYKLCDGQSDGSTRHLPVCFSSLLVPGSFGPGDIAVVMYDDFEIAGLGLLAYALRPVEGGRYRYLGLCRGCQIYQGPGSVWHGAEADETDELADPPAELPPLEDFCLV